MREPNYSFSSVYTGERTTMPKTVKGYLIVRHTRSGDEPKGFTINLRHAMADAEDIANEAAYAYGEGSASVFNATLRIVGKPIQQADIPEDPNA